MKIIFASLAFLGAITDVYLTNYLVKAGKREANPLVKWIIKVFKNKAWIPHLLMWSVLIGIPFIFDVGDTTIGYIMMILVQLYAIIHNYEIYRKMK